MLGCFYGANTNEWQAMAMARRGNDKALAYAARQRALDPLSPCETQVSDLLARILGRILGRRTSFRLGQAAC